MFWFICFDNLMSSINQSIHLWQCHRKVNTGLAYIICPETQLKVDVSVAPCQMDVQPANFYNVNVASMKLLVVKFIVETALFYFT